MTTLQGIRSIEQLDLKNKRVFIRVDFNVPLDKSTGKITDDERIRAAFDEVGQLLFLIQLFDPLANTLDHVVTGPPVAEFHVADGPLSCRLGQRYEIAR